MLQRIADLRRAAYMFGVFLALTMVAGCNSLPGWGGVDIDTARKATVQASAEVRAGYLLLENLIDNQAISASDARRIKMSLDQADDGVQSLFNQIRASGDPSQVADTLDRTLVALDVAMGLLGAYTQPDGGG